MKNIRIFYQKTRFLAVKFSVYLNRRVFVMFLRYKITSEIFHFFFQKITAESHFSRKVAYRYQSENNLSSCHLPIDRDS